MYQLYCRMYQFCLRAFSYFLPWRKPELLEGQNSLNKLAKLIKSKGIHNVLVVTDNGIASLGLMSGFLKSLADNGVAFAVYDKTVPNPTIENVEQALQLYKTNQCEGIVAFGGGSSMDCAKGVGALAVKPGKSISQIKGLLKVRKKIPPFFAIPTTAGTGSEATVAAVITDSSTHEKYVINDLALISHYAVLDPLMTVGLPPAITSTTGIDALTHAIEAYIGKSNTRETRFLSKKAVKLIFENIMNAYSDGTNLMARENMLKASYYAGVAFTRAYVGNVHAIAHAVGGLYGIPHGLANAVILPYVLEYYGETVYKPLAELADLVEIAKPSDTVAQKAERFIEAIKSLNRNMNIPGKISGIIDSDIPLMVKRALNEANPLYPVPKILSRNDLIAIYQLIKE
ncbi:MAG TPA: alcohol dehydrogenase [Firmicutes bacterium]|jgi:alcohol dehydrogenase|nr:alcohol dehydrogenase [Bacillota bacterium]